MAFTVTDKNPNPQSAGTNAPQSSRDRAIAAFNKAAEGLKAANSGNTQREAVANPSAVSPEELGAIRAPQSKASETADKNDVNTASQSDQENKSENPGEATSEGSKQPLSAQYAQLARKEKALRAQVTELKGKEAELAKREEALAAKDAEYSSKFISKDKLKEDIVGTLLEAGLTYDEVTQAFLSQPQTPQDSALSAEIRSLKAELKAMKADSEGTKKSIAENQTKQYQDAVNQIRKDAERLVESDANFETIKETGNSEEIVKLIQKTFEEEHYLMTVEDAAQAIEDELVEEISKYSRLSKIQKKLQGPSASPGQKKTDPAPQNQSQQQQSAKTLSNNMSSGRPMTARERAIAAFEGKLKKD